MVLVTGATGLLGRVLVLQLLQQGKTVRACKRKTSDIEKMRDSLRYYSENSDTLFEKIDWIEVDFQDIESLQKAVKDIQEVYHTAAWVSFHPDDRKKMEKINIIGTQNLLYVCENSSVKKFCHISSIAVFDNVNEQGEINEDCHYNPKINHSDYAMSKYFSEMEVWRNSFEGLPSVILNPGVIIGSGNWKKSSGILFDNALKRKYTFHGGTAYVDVRDVAKIAIHLMDENAFGERYILVSENRRFQEVNDLIRKQAGKSPSSLYPKGLLKLLPFLKFTLGWLIPPLRMATRSNIETVTTFQQVSNRKIKEKLNYNFISIKESIAFHYKNYKKSQTEK